MGATNISMEAESVLSEPTLHPGSGCSARATPPKIDVKIVKIIQSSQTSSAAKSNDKTRRPPSTKGTGRSQSRSRSV